MSDWVQALARSVYKEVQTNGDWRQRFDQVSAQSSKFSLHVAVFNEPYLQYILDGKKTVDSRFSIRPCPPYGAVNKGDILLLKRSGGPIIGMCQVDAVWYYRLNPDLWQVVRSFAGALCATDDEFWRSREKASYATLIGLGTPVQIGAVSCGKRDRRGWVVIRRDTVQLTFEVGKR